MVTKEPTSPRPAVRPGEVTRHLLSVDIATVAAARGERVAVEVFLPSTPAGPALIWWLQSGGGMSRRYWSLEVPGETENYSFVRYLTAQGFIAVTIDHLGTGDSSRPSDGFALTPELIADINAEAHQRIHAGLTDGTLIEGLRPLPALSSIGCGHSMGAALTVYQQARHRSHRALCLLGFGGRGLPSHLPPPLAPYADAPEALRRDLVAVVRTLYPEPLPIMPRGNDDFLISVPIPPRVRKALSLTRTNLLAVTGLSVMVPGSAAAEIAAIDVPVFLGHGDHDIGPPLHEVGADFSASDDVTLYRLTGSGHNHNVSPNRERLWQRITTWATKLPESS